MYGALTTLDRGLMLRLFRNGVLLAALQAVSEESMQYLRLLLGAQVSLEQLSAAQCSLEQFITALNRCKLLLGAQLGERFERHMINRMAEHAAFYHLGQARPRLAPHAYFLTSHVSRLTIVYCLPSTVSRPPRVYFLAATVGRRETVSRLPPRPGRLAVHGLLAADLAGRIGVGWRSKGK